MATLDGNEQQGEDEKPMSNPVGLAQLLEWSLIFWDWGQGGLSQHLLELKRTRSG